jgi:hypothetical protein
MGVMRNSYEILARKPPGKKPHGRQRHEWKDNIIQTECEWRWGLD